MKKLNFLSKLCRLSRASQYCDVGIDRRLTVGSPSGLHRLSQYIAITLLLLVVGVGNAWGATATFTASDQGWSGTSTKTQTVSGVTFSFAGGTTNPTYYAADGLRTYENCVITISSTNTITGIVFTYTISNSGYLKSFNTGTWTSGTKTWSGSATSINCTVGHSSGSKNGQVRITSIVVTYTPSAASHTLSSSVSPAASGSVELSATSVAEGSTATATATPAAHYTFTSWSISGTGASLSSTTTNPTTVTMGTANATVTATFTAVPKASITLSEAGATTTDASTYYVGDSYTLPSSTGASCGTKVLVGWSTVEVAETNTKPTSNFYEKGASVTLAATQTFYAVFATASGGGGAEWVETTIGDLTGSDIFVLATPGGYAVSNNNGTSSAPTAISITVSAGKITSSVTDAMKWNLGGNSTDGYIFYPNGTTATWLYCSTTASSSSNNNIRVGTGDRNHWIADGDGDYVTNDTYTDRWLCNYNNADFRGYIGSSVTSDIVSKFYKYSAGTTYSAYSTTCGSTYTITLDGSPAGTVPGGTFSASAASASAGTVITLTATPSRGYEFGSWTVTDASSNPVTVTSNQFTMPSSNVTVRATFNALTPLTITLSTNSKGAFTNPSPWPIYSGESFTFPTVTPSDDECATFLGWIEGKTFDGDGETTDPTDVTSLAEYHAASTSSGVLTTNKIYTAVFGEKDTQVTPAYVKVTSAPADWSGTYLIVYEGTGVDHTGAVAFDGSLASLDAGENGVAVTITSNAIAKSSYAANQFTIAKIPETSTYSILSASAKYIGRAANSNGMDVETTVQVNSISYDGTNNCVRIDGSGDRSLRYNSNSGSTNLRFRYYSYDNQQPIQLYKLGEAELETYTYTTNPACTPRYRVTVNSATGGSPSADKVYEHAAETITLTANPGAGYSFTGWAMENSSTHADATSLLSSSTAATATFSMPAYDVTVTATYAKKMVSTLEVKDGATVVSTTTGPVSGTVNISTGANKTLDVVITPSDAYDHSWTATVSDGSSYASITNVTDDGFRVNGLAQGDATITVNAPNDGSAKSVTLTVQVRDIMPEEIILKREGSDTPIETLTMYYDASASQGQYVKVNVSYSPSNPTNKSFTFSSAATGKVGSHSHAPASGYEVLVANGVTSSAVNCMFTSSADGSVTKVLAVTVLPILTDTFVDYIHGNATQTVSARLSADRYDIITEINTPSLSDASDAEPASADCETSHYHLIGWLPQATAEALWAARTPITDDTEGLVKAGVTVEATGQTWCAIWSKEL